MLKQVEIRGIYSSNGAYFFFGALFPQRALFGALLSCDDHRKILEEYIPLIQLDIQA